MKVALGTREFTVEELELIGGGTRATRDDTKEWVEKVLVAELEALAEGVDEEEEDEATVYTEDDLLEMDLDELQGILEEEKIECSKPDKKKKVVKAILDWQETLEDEGGDEDEPDPEEDFEDEEEELPKKSKKGKKSKKS